MTHENDSRYPYTHACDLIRMVAGYNKDGTKLSRADSSQIIKIFAKVSGLDDIYLAEKLADYYLAYENEIAAESVKGFQSAVDLSTYKGTER